jgi:hypothetical protein
MTWNPETPGAPGAIELIQRFRAILEQLETGDYAAASDAMRHWSDDAELEGVADEVVGRIRICIMDARAELIHMEPDAAQAYIRQALALTAIAA